MSLTKSRQDAYFISFISRSGESHIRIQRSNVAQDHAEISINSDGQAFIQNFDSTLLNGNPLKKISKAEKSTSVKVLLNNKDYFTIDGREFRFEYPEVILRTPVKSAKTSQRTVRVKDTELRGSPFNTKPEAHVATPSKPSKLSATPIKSTDGFTPSSSSEPSATTLKRMCAPTHSDDPLIENTLSTGIEVPVNTPSLSRRGSVYAKTSIGTPEPKESQLGSIVEDSMNPEDPSNENMTLERSTPLKAIPASYVAMEMEMNTNVPVETPIDKTVTPSRGTPVRRTLRDSSAVFSAPPIERTIHLDSAATKETPSMRRRLPPLTHKKSLEAEPTMTHEAFLNDEDKDAVLRDNSTEQEVIANASSSLIAPEMTSFLTVSGQVETKDVQNPPFESSEDNNSSSVSVVNEENLLLINHQISEDDQLDGPHLESETTCNEGALEVSAETLINVEDSELNVGFEQLFAEAEPGVEIFVGDDEVSFCLPAEFCCEEPSLPDESGLMIPTNTIAPSLGLDAQADAESESEDAKNSSMLLADASENDQEARKGNVLMSPIRKSARLSCAFNQSTSPTPVTPRGITSTRDSTVAGTPVLRTPTDAPKSTPVATIRSTPLSTKKLAMSSSPARTPVSLQNLDSSKLSMSPLSEVESVGDAAQQLPATDVIQSPKSARRDSGKVTPLNAKYTRVDVAVATPFTGQRSRLGDRVTTAEEEEAMPISQGPIVYSATASPSNSNTNNCGQEIPEDISNLLQSPRRSSRRKAHQQDDFPEIIASEVIVAKSTEDLNDYVEQTNDDGETTTKNEIDAFTSSVEAELDHSKASSTSQPLRRSRRATTRETCVPAAVAAVRKSTRKASVHAESSDSEAPKRRTRIISSVEEEHSSSSDPVPPKKRGRVSTKNVEESVDSESEPPRRMTRSSARTLKRKA